MFCDRRFPSTNAAAGSRNERLGRKALPMQCAKADPITQGHAGKDLSWSDYLR